MLLPSGTSALAVTGVTDSIALRAGTLSGLVPANVLFGSTVTLSTLTVTVFERSASVTVNVPSAKSVVSVSVRLSVSPPSVITTRSFVPLTVTTKSRVTVAPLWSSIWRV